MAQNINFQVVLKNFKFPIGYVYLCGAIGLSTCDRSRRLATDLVGMGSSPATVHIRYALFVNQPK